MLAMADAVAAPKTGEANDLPCRRGEIGRRLPPVRACPHVKVISERTAVVLIAVGALATTVLAFASAPQPIVLTIPLVAHLAGLLAGYEVAVMMVLMARVPALERGIGADRLARWHGFGGRTVLVLMLVHAVAATIGWARVAE
jgi:predicted ferric reductase